ncbi:hypothetical protein ACF5W4_03850 [Bacillota bacterium Lsc_1132]
MFIQYYNRGRGSFHFYPYNSENWIKQLLFKNYLSTNLEVLKAKEAFE